MENGRRLRIFIFHGSHALTDHDAHGDGLVAWGFLSELAKRGHRIAVATHACRIATKLPENLTVEVIAPKTGSVLRDYVAYALAARAAYDRFAAEAPVDVVHQMNPVFRGLSLGMLGRRVPVVLGTYVGEWPRLSTKSGWRGDPFGPREWLATFGKRAIDTLSQLAATSLTITTPYARTRIPLAFALRDRIAYVHHGVDLTLFGPEPRADDPPPRPGTILYVGSLEYKKGVVALARAFVTVAARVPYATLAIIGDGDQESLLRKTFAEHGVAERVTWVGRQSRAGVAGWMRAADVLCAPSFSEPYGQNLLEAMATGKPVVATTAGGHPYLVDPRGGILIEPGDHVALASALETLLRDRARAQAMGAFNRELVRRRNDWTKVTDDLEAVYARAIARFGRHRDRGRVAPSLAPPDASDARVTIVVATKNRAADFARLYRSIRTQPTQPHRIIVVDQSDEPYAVQRAADVDYVWDRSIRGLTAARNAGIARLDDAPYVLFLDDDAEFAADVVAIVARTFARRRDAIGLQCEVEQPADRAVLEQPGIGSRIWRQWEAVFNRGFFDNRLGPTRPRSDEIDRVHGCAMAFRRTLFTHELFDPNLVEYSYGEDWEFSRRALRHGRLYLARGAQVIHHESPANRLRQQRLLTQRWQNFNYFYRKFENERQPIDALWRCWWMCGETIVWLKKGFGFPRGPARRPSAP